MGLSRANRPLFFEIKAESVSENSVLWPPTHRGAGVSPAGSGGVPPPVPMMHTRSEGVGGQDGGTTRFPVRPNPSKSE